MDLKHWTLIVSTISDLSDGLPLILLFKFRPFKYKILRGYFLSSFLIKLFTILLVFGYGSPNTHPYYHLLAPVEFTFLFLYYSALIGWSLKRAIYPISLVIVFNIINSIFIQNLHMFNSYAWSINTVVLMGMSFLYLYNLYLKAEDISIETHSDFIINAAFLLYYAGSLFTYMLGFSILSNEAKDLFGNGWIFQAGANIIKNSIAAYGIYRSHSNK